MTPHLFNVGDYVNKVSGYAFPGKVVSVFWTTSGQLRYVVEMQHYGLLHILNETQLRKMDLNEPRPSPTENPRVP